MHITIINLVLMIAATVLVLVSDSHDTRAIREFLFERFIREMVLIYLVVIFFVALWNRGSRQSKIVNVASTVITLAALTHLFRQLQPY